MVHQVAQAVSMWADVAASHKLRPRELERMESAFAPEELRRALAIDTTATVQRPSARRRKRT
jgi:hypothetical protein